MQHQNTSLSPPKAPVLGLDYYLENGYWVFTEKFLRERGHCCKSGCRHCPYRKKRNADPTSGQGDG
ncbi:MAG TPA: DUF5522 domain-containing protein [Saprospiraceae bacterium]|nr:DUF5522 domain-containing protein [Saprospiraceae bacterium]HND88470.1 DUF5522 domain-containing protein [Saprospiraceae bacterium]